MIQAKCIEKFRDKNNKIVGYRLIDLNSKTQDFTPETLKNAINNKKIHVVNLTLTSDGRLITTADKGLPYKAKPIKMVEQSKQNTGNIIVSDLAKAFTLLEWSYVDMGDAFKDSVEYLCDAAGMETDIWSMNDKKDLTVELNKAHQILLNENPSLLANRLKHLLTEEGEYYSNQIKDYMYSEGVSKLSDSKMYKAVYLIYKSFKDSDKKLAKIIKEELLDDMKQNGIASIRLGYGIGHEYYRYLDGKLFGTISNDVFTVGHAITSSDIKEHKEYKGYSYVFHKDINKCGKPTISIAALFKNAEAGKVQVDLKIERHGYLNERQNCVGIRGYILDVETIILNIDTPNEINSKTIAKKFNELAPKLYDLADIHQSLYSNLGYNKSLEKVQIEDLNSHGRLPGKELVSLAISRWTTIRGEKTPAKIDMMDYQSDTSFRIIYGNNISDNGNDRRLYIKYNGKEITLKVLDGNDINKVIIEENAQATGSIEDNSSILSEVICKALISANVRRI